MEKILILEADWRATPNAPPSQSQRATPLYCSAFQHSSLIPRCRDLRASTIANECRTFLRLAENQRGANFILLSSHGEFLASGQRALAATEQTIVLEPLLHHLRPLLSRTLLILDVCQIGQALPSLCQHSGLLGVLGFQARVNWTASSIFILSWLRHCVAAEILLMRRASSQRPAKLLAQMQNGDYAKLARQLAVQAAWKHQQKCRID